jgi:hypothetical protein
VGYLEIMHPDDRDRGRLEKELDYLRSKFERMSEFELPVSVEKLRVLLFLIYKF